MTKRQLEVLRMVRDAMQKGEPWINLGLTSVAQGNATQITWDELQWVSEFEKQAMLNRIEASLLVADAVHAAHENLNSENPLEIMREIENKRLEREGAPIQGASCAPWSYPRCTP